MNLQLGQDLTWVAHLCCTQCLLGQLEGWSRNSPRLRQMCAVFGAGRQLRPQLGLHMASRVTA